MAHSDLVMGVDGGGTKTVAWVAPLEETTNGIVLGRGTAGPGNPRAAGFEVAQDNIRAAAQQALAAAGRSQAPVAAACFGLAGAGRDVEQTRITAWALQEQLALQVRVTGDAEPILAAASTDHWGIALIGGTGSLAWGRNRDGHVARCGGWGYLIGDEGSAFAMAVAALQAAMQSHDGRRPVTPLALALPQHYGVTDPSELINVIYAAETTRDQIAACASVVFEFPDDPLAADIIARAADELALMVSTLRQRLDLPVGEYPLAIAGGLLLNQDRLRAALLEQLTACNSAPGEVTLVRDPVQGDVALARRLARNSA